MDVKQEKQLKLCIDNIDSMFKREIRQNPQQAMEILTAVQELLGGMLNWLSWFLKNVELKKKE